MKVGVIGPTDLDKLSELMGGSQDSFLMKAAQVGCILAGVSCCELWVNGDGGMLAAVAEAYKSAGGKKLVVLIPRREGPWPLAHTEPHAERADQVRRVPSWFRANYDVVSEVDICICVGLSAGVLSELAYIKWDAQFAQGNLRKLIVVKELVRGGILPPEIEESIGQLVQYVRSVEDLASVLGEEECAPQQA